MTNAERAEMEALRLALLRQALHVRAASEARANERHDAGEARAQRAEARALALACERAQHLAAQRAAAARHEAARVHEARARANERAAERAYRAQRDAARASERAVERAARAEQAADRAAVRAAREGARLQRQDEREALRRARRARGSPIGLLRSPGVTAALLGALLALPFWALHAASYLARVALGARR